MLDEVYYYISNDTVTKKDVAENFGRSLSSVNKDFQKFRQYVESNPGSEYDNWYSLMEHKAITMAQVGRIKGGMSTNSGRPLIISDDKIVEIAIELIKSSKTLRDMADSLNISKSTLYENLLRVEKLNNSVYVRLRRLFLENSNRGNEHGKRRI